jgi:hypothetical protein
MTVLILDHPSWPLPPYPEWLADLGEELILLTGRLASEIRGDGYAQVLPIPRYASSAEPERHAARIAERSAPRGLIAIAGPDRVRAGALRDFLGIAGESADRARVLVDLAELRGRLSKLGVPTVPFRPVHRPADFYWSASVWGFPLRVRRRRDAGWTEAGLLRGERDISAFLPGVFEPGFVSVPSLVLEPGPGAADTRARLVSHGGDGPSSDAWAEAPGAEAARRALAALRVPVESRWAVELRRDTAGGWLVDTVTENTVSRNTVADNQGGFPDDAQRAVREQLAGNRYAGDERAEEGGDDR